MANTKQELIPCGDHPAASPDPDSMGRLSRCTICGFYVDLEEQFGAVDDPENERIRDIEITEGMAAAIVQLHETGLFGLTEQDVIERLICDRIIQLAAEGWIDLDEPAEPANEPETEE